MHLLTPKRASGADTIRDGLGPPPWAPREKQGLLTEPEQGWQVLKASPESSGDEG